MTHPCKHCGIPSFLSVCGLCMTDLIVPGKPSASLLVQPLHDREREEHLMMPYFPTSETTDGDW
jgi:hypothetical protein